MTPEERIAAGGAVLALDTNAIYGLRRLAKLCNHVNLLRSAADPLDIRLCVPAVVHMEVLFDLRQNRGPGFDANIVVQSLVDKGLTIAPFEERHAMHAAERLAESFPQNADWQAAKRRHCIDCLGLGLPEDKARELASRKRSCGATIDWVIAAHAAHEGWILVTNDNQSEFAGLKLKMKLEQLEQILVAQVERRCPAGPAD
jgi:predicted nucleic acid-binding protein